MAEELMDTEEAARRLGVKRETIYAYVSRGLLPRHPASTPRHSEFGRDAVELLASRARQPNRSNALDVVVETELTLLDPAGRLSFRGRDAIELARYRSFEEVVDLLWDGPPSAPWPLDEAGASLVERLNEALDDGIEDTDRMLAIVATLAAADGSAGDRTPNAVRHAGTRAFAAILAGLPRRQKAVAASAAAQLWAVLADHDRPPRPAQLSALNAALILLADHELATSTFAARVAASAWASPYRVVLTGLGSLGSELHGGASGTVESLLDSINDLREIPETIDRQLAIDGQLPGFGHPVYRDRDPRADYLLERLGRVGDDVRGRELAFEILNVASARGLRAPNVDFALAALVRSMCLRPGSAVAIFTFARIAGIIGHALEEYRYRLRFRPRASYIGRRPSP